MFSLPLILVWYHS